MNVLPLCLPPQQQGKLYFNNPFCEPVSAKTFNGGNESLTNVQFTKL